MPLVNCEISHILTWSEKCLLTSEAARDAVPAQGGTPAVAAVNYPTNATFKITDTNCMFQLLLYQLEMIIIFWTN